MFHARFNIIPSVMTPLPSSLIQAEHFSGYWGLWPVHNCSFFLLMWFFSMLQCVSIPQAAVLHKLLQHSSSPPGTCLYRQTAPVWVPQRTQVPSENLFCEICYVITSPARSQLPSGFYMGCSFYKLYFIFICCVVSSCKSCSGMSVPECSSMGYKGTTCVTKMFPMGWRRISALYLEHCLPFLLHWLWGLQGCFCHT